MLPQNVKTVITEELGLQGFLLQQVHGGDINQSFALNSCDERYFLKFNDDDLHLEILESEAKSLRYLAKHDINCPQVISSLHKDSYSILILEWIEGHRNWNAESIDSFVDNLTSLHQIKAQSFGLHFDNCIGQLPQKNGHYDGFADYYWHSRIEVQLIISYEAGYLNSPDSYKRIYDHLKDFPKEEPCLIHGDLWSGNYIHNNKNQSYLIDPSISYGSREMDIAMMRLFGGFPNQLIERYNEAVPLIKGWETRIKIFQLYYLLVHLNMFGSSYLPQVNNILKAFEK